MTLAPEALVLRIHGGPDARGPARHDFSTNSNACGPCPHALHAMQNADPACYPDAAYTALRSALAHFHGVDAGRMVLAGSASEFIFRITAWVRQQGGQTVRVPQHAYGDYAHAAQAWGLRVLRQDGQLLDDADLHWACEPSSPLGQNHAAWHAGNGSLGSVGGGVCVLDCAYAPLRLSGHPSLSDAEGQQVWRLFSPNKALGLTGVRGAYAIAPVGHGAAARQLDALAPSWVLGAHGVAMLTAWVQPEVQGWLRGSLDTLRDWKARQIGLLQAQGWTVQPSDANFFCARPPEGVDAVALCTALRTQGIQLRDATSFGLPGWVRLGVLGPVAQNFVRD
jgi:histidinol-phosphate aminotransferase